MTDRNRVVHPTTFPPRVKVDPATMNHNSYEEIAVQWVADRKQSKVSCLLVALAQGAMPSRRILGLGCGGGAPIARYLQKQGFTITGIDSSQRRIALARENLVHS
jgi:2-polyprenyl-3-methyl-5-hydroxy-6-metoxy-1,4-benzoquinol methylase